VSSRHARGAAGGPTPAPGTATADLHAHTLRSDGVLEPAELVRQAADAGIRLFAIADHDNLAAYRELCAPGAGPLPAGLALVPAVEINSITHGIRLELSEGELHMLGIGVDPDDAAFEAVLAAQRDARRIRFQLAVDKLRDIGKPIDEQLAVMDIATDGALGRPTLGRAMMAAGYVESVDEAFRVWIGHGRPGYVARTGLDPVGAIHAIRAAGGLASLAHFAEAPARIGLLRDLIAEGLGGLETNHRSFDADTRTAMARVAANLKLVATGGSDYHGDNGPYAATHALLVMPDALVAGVRAAIAETAWGQRTGFAVEAGAAA